MRRLMRRLKYWIHFRQAEEELAEEIEIHRAMQQERLEREGMPPGRALANSRRVMGSVLLAREDARGVWVWPWLDRMRQDFVYGVRMLRKSPAFTVVAIVSLALGIGANTAIFTLVNAVFLRPIPVPDISNVYALGTIDPMLKRTVWGWDGLSLPNFQDIRRQSTVFSGLAAAHLTAFSWKQDNQTRRTFGESVTSNYFDVLAVKPILGRTFLPTDDPIQGTNAAILSYRMWTDQFAADPAVIGTEIVLDSLPFTVVGVAPAEFKGTKVIADVDQVWVSIGTLGTAIPGPAAARRQTDWSVFARVRPEVSRMQASGEITAIAANLGKEFPAENGGRGIRLTPLSEYAHSTFSGAILPVLAGMVTLAAGLILTIVCINLANLQLARASYRQREVSIRMALGGSRGRIVRQLLMESVILSVVGGMSAFVVMYWTLAWFSPPIKHAFGAIDLRMDSRVLLFSGATSLLCGILFGLAPALRVSKPDIRSMIQRTGAGASMPWSRNRLARTLVVSQVALSMVMLVCAALFIRMLQKAESRDIGYDFQQLVSVQVDLSKANYRPEQGQQFYRNAMERLQGLSAVEAVVINGNSQPVTVFSEDNAHLPDYLPISAVNTPVSMNYFSALRISMLEGYDFSDSGTDDTHLVAVITRSMATRLAPGKDAVGKRFHFGRETQEREVIGVIPDPGYTQVVPLFMYTPITQAYEQGAAIRIRVSDNPRTHLKQFREAVQALDPNITIASVDTMHDIMMSEVTKIAIVSAPMHFAAILALALAVIGIYGVTAYSLAQRTQEIGIRIALGAQRRDVILMILGDGTKLSFIGTAIGLALSRGAAPAFSSFMPYTLNVVDPLAFIGAAVVLIAVALFACYIPARRATRVDPVVALRYE